MKKLIALTMTLTFVLSCIISSHVFAAQSEELAPYASSYFATYAVELSDAGSGRVKVEYNVKGKSTVEEIGVKKIIIQEKNGSTWNDVQTYTSSNYPSFIVTGTTLANGSVTYSGDEGSTYRAKVTFYAKDASGSATKTSTSSSLTV